MLTVIVPFFNGHHHLDKLLNSIPDGIKIIIIDDLSDKPLQEAGRAQIIRLDKKGYFTGAVNEGLRRSNGDVLIVNQDTYFTNNQWLTLIDQQKNDYDLIGEGVLRHPAWPKGYIHGTFMYIKRKVIDAVGLMNEVDYPLWGSTCDYQLRAARKGFKALSIPPGQIPGFVHKRGKKSYGDAIDSTLKTEGKRGLFIRTPPMISVVIGCYNHGQFLQDAVNSLIGGKTCLGNHPGQTFQSFEIIIVDDGSTDETPEVCKNLVSAEKGIKYIRQHNMGSAAAMNTGIQKALGKYIAPLDADDMMEPERLETMLRAIENNPHSVIYDNVSYFSQSKANGKWVRGFTTKKGWELTMTLPEYNFEQLINKNGMHKGLLYTKKAWEDVGGYPSTMNKGREDWAFNVALGIKGYCGIHTKKDHYLYRRNWTSRTFTNTTPNWHNIFREQMRGLYPEIYRGERPMGCCGGKRTSKYATTKAVSMSTLNQLPGKDGMVILEYSGTNSGDETWVGPVTGQVYVLGGSKKRGYVDVNDAGARPGANSDGNGMLSWRQNGRYIFNLYQPPVVVEPEPEPELMVEVAAVNVAVVDITNMTVLEIREAIGGWSDAELMDALETELENKNRITVIGLLEAGLA